MPSPSAMKPLAISSAAASRLTSSCQAILIAHYRHGIETRLDGDGEVLFISGTGRGILPMHIVMRGNDLSRLMQLPVGALLTFPADCCVNRTDATPCLHMGGRVVHTFLPAQARQYTIDHAALSRALTAILPALSPLFSRSQTTGLGVPIDALFEPQWQWRTAFEPTSNANPDSTLHHEQAVRALLGRGQGATPAGDDMLLGALALQRALLAQPLLSTTLTHLDTQLPHLTTATSVAYLRWALRGIFGSHLLSLVRSIRDGKNQTLIARCANRVAQHGASSGYDTLLGILLAGRALIHCC